ncbi:MAG: VCBS repeat-containing protein [Deltaproteobacteria bacterium]
MKLNKIVKLILTITILALFGAHCGEPEGEISRWLNLSSKHGDLPEPGPSTQQTASLVLDVDKDGLNDFVIGSRENGSSVYWYKREAVGWKKYMIEKDTLPVEAGGAFHDIDRDGDPDIVFGADASDNKMWWWENPYPDFDPELSWKRHVIKNSGANKHHDQVFGDFDGDGEVELVFWNQGDNKLFLAEVPPEPENTEPWPYTAIFTSESESEGLFSADIDLDGKQDIVGGGHWFKHLGGDNFDPQTIDKNQVFSRVEAGQLIKGGPPEVVFVIGDGVGPLKWYEWKNGGWKGHDLLKFDVYHGHSLEIEDMNGDGNLDIFAAEMRPDGNNEDARMWIFYGNGKGDFKKRAISVGFGSHESRVSDLDGDGDLDILVKPYNWDTPRIDVLLNSWDWKRRVVDAGKPSIGVFITSADLNNDGRKDLVTGGFWYRNPGRINGKWKRIPIGDRFNNMASVYDFDGDGDMDILGTEGEGSSPNSDMLWAENDGSGNFKIHTNIPPGDGDFLQGAAVDRFQGESLQIALSWHEDGKDIQLLTVPDNPADSRWRISTVPGFSQNEALSAGDIDRDDDQDLLLGTKWLRNDGSSWEEMTIIETDDAPPDRNLLVDINQDGRLDAVVGYEAVSKPGKLAWYEQKGDASAPEWEEHLIGIITGPMSLDVGDVDKDGDTDVVAGEHNIDEPSRAKLYFFENKDGGGTKWSSHIIHMGDEHHDGAQLADIDGDGDLDVISIGWTHRKVIIYENKSLQ